MPGRRKAGSSVKDEELYEELREEGNSKQKSARIANAAASSSRSAIGRKGGRSAPYNEWSKEALVKKARAVGIKGRSKMTKAELISALRDS